MKKCKKYYYFISYSHKLGFGNSRCELSFKIDTFSNIEKITKLLCEWNGFDNIVILNIIQIENKREVSDVN